MNKAKLLSKNEHRLTLKNYSDSTIRSYLYGLQIFLSYLSDQNIKEVSPKFLQKLFYHCKKELNDSYSMM